jgi:hypothetical protein
MRQLLVHVAYAMYLSLGTARWSGVQRSPVQLPLAIRDRCARWIQDTVNPNRSFNYVVILHRS